MSKWKKIFLKIEYFLFNKMSESKEPTNKPLKKGKTLLLFDIDGTLTPARQTMKQNMYDCLKKASQYEDIDLATVGGSDLPKAKEQLQTAIDFCHQVLQRRETNRLIIYQFLETFLGKLIQQVWRYHQHLHV